MVMMVEYIFSQQNIPSQTSVVKKIIWFGSNIFTGGATIAKDGLVHA